MCIRQQFIYNKKHKINDKILAVLIVEVSELLSEFPV